METPVGVVVFFDLAGYSKTEIPRQVQLGSSFMGELADAMAKLYPDHRPERTRQCPYLILPTGDGAAVVLWRQSPDHPRPEYTGLWLGGRMLTWARDEEVGLRCGIHMGPLEFVTDPYGSLNVCGAAINEAQRIMDAAREGQLLVHADSVAPRLYSVEEKSREDFHYRLRQERHEVLVKHGRILPVMSVTGVLRGNGEDRPFGEEGEPAEKWFLQIEPATTEIDDYGIPIKKPFKEMLLQSRHMAFVGATHDQIPDVFKEVLAGKLDQRWPRVAFFFLEDDALRWIRSDAGGRRRSHDETVAAKKKARQELEHLLRDRVRDLEFRAYRFPYFFASFLDWEAPGGRIHVSPYVWGLNVRECPGLDYRWSTPKPPRPYSDYRRGLDELWQDKWSRPF